MKYYIVDPNNDEVTKVPDYLADGIIKQYLDRKYTFVIGVGSFLIGFFSGLVACLTK